MSDEKNIFQKRHAVSKGATRMVTVNGVRLAYEIHGTGEIPLVLVHGWLESRRTWDRVVPHLDDSFRVITYDLRGYGESERPSDRTGSSKHVADLAALIEHQHLELSSAWVAGQSSGGEMALFLAAKQPDLLRGIIAHEPGFGSLLADDPAMAPMLDSYPQLVAEVTERIKSGDHAGGAEQFVEEGLGKGLWAKFPPDFRQDLINNAPNTLDDLNDPDASAFDLEWVREFTRPVLLTIGDQTAPMYPPVITKLAEALPSAEIKEITGAGHPVQAQRPEEFAKAINAFVRRHTND